MGSWATKSGRTMETQSMLDALTDHLAIYYRSSGTKTESRSRQAVVEWLANLDFDQRRAALTIVDASWVAILVKMQSYLRKEGLCTFFLLPDVPVIDRPKASVSTMPSRKSELKQEKNGKGIPKGRVGVADTSHSPPDGQAIDENCASCALTLPALCFRRARGLVWRSETENQQNSGDLLVRSIRLFSSADGEDKARLCSLNASSCFVNCVTVAENFIAEIDTFLKVMDDLSHHEFLNVPSPCAASRWEETSWLKSMGYYSLPAFIANKFEIELSSAWSRAHQTKKPPRSLSLKLKDMQNGWTPGSCSCYVHGNAAVAASIFRKKQGFMDWWRTLGSKDRGALTKCALAYFTKSEVLNIVEEARTARTEVHDDLKIGGQLKTISGHPGSTNLNIVHRRNLSDLGPEQHVTAGTDDAERAKVPPYLIGLRVLTELSESGFLCERSEVIDFIQERDTSWLFGSTLESLQTASGYVRRKVRNALVKVKNDYIELELLGDGARATVYTVNKGKSTETKVSKANKKKEMKKKRKCTTTPKAGAPKEEDKICSSKMEHMQEKKKQEGHMQRGPDEAEMQAQSSAADYPSEAKSTCVSKQHVSRKGKGGKPKQKKDSRAHHPIVGIKITTMNAEEFFKPINDRQSYSDGSLETRKCPCSDINGSPSFADSPLYSSQSSEPQVEISAELTQHCRTDKSSSTCKILNLAQEKTWESHSTPITVLFSPRVNGGMNNLSKDENLRDKLVSGKGIGSSSFASEGDICRIGSTICTAPEFSQELPIKIQALPGFTSVTSDCWIKLKDPDSKQTFVRAALPTAEGTSLLVERQNCVPDSKVSFNMESSMICFGTVDAASSKVKETSSVPVLTKSLVKAKLPLKSSNEKSLHETSPINSKSGPSSRNERLRFPTAARQLDYSSSSHPQCQQSPLFTTVPHEWPGSPQFGYFGAYHQPTATDWLQLDVGRGWPHQMEPSLLSYRNTSVLRQGSGQAESLIPRSVATRTGNLGNINGSPLLQPRHSISPVVGYTIRSKEDPRLNVRSFLSTTPFSSGHREVEATGQGQGIDDLEQDEKLAYDTDVDDFGTYRSGEFDDLDGYMISEEEGERYSEDAENINSDYHQAFGGGVMYWNSSDYTGLGYSRPGSLSSEDSSWARHEADLSAVLDDIVNYQPLQNSYSGKASTSSNVPSCSPSPPSSSSIPKSFEKLSPVAASNPLNFLSTPTEFSGKFVPLTNQGFSLDDQYVGPTVPIPINLLEQIRADSSAQPILRPIVVVRDQNLPIQLSSGEARVLKEVKSPNIVPCTRRDLLGHRRRPPSPVLRCVPPAPPPPPPSPVSGPRRRKRLMGARSGSSSPRHWGLVDRPYRDESEVSEWKPKGENQEGFTISGRKQGNTTGTLPMHPLSGALLRECLVAIPPLSLEQEHPMKTSLLNNSNPALHLALTRLLSALHLEIEAFRLQVEVENKRRKPFIDMAVKKVTHALQVLWPRSRINIFGSVATGLALPTSDVDLVVCLPPVRNLEPIKEAGILEGRNGIKETSLQHAARYLADQDWVKNDTMKTVENTPVPIIMMVAEFQINLSAVGDEDMAHSFCSSICKETCKAAAKTQTLMPVPLPKSNITREDGNFVPEEKKGPWGGKRARQMVHLDISFETPSHTGLRTAELVRELIGQYPALAPLALVLKQFLTDRSLDHPYSGGLSSYCLVLLITRFLQHQHHHGKPSTNQNLGRLFLDFLHFFGCVFDPLRMGIRIRGGGMFMSRDRYNNIDPLYIEDPLYPDNNVGRNCFRILQCVKAFADGYAVLENKLHDISNVSEDVDKGTKCLQLLQMILPCILTK